MKILKKIIYVVLAFGLLGYAALCIWFYTAQEKALFRTVKHPSSYRYHFAGRFEERNIKMEDGKSLNGVLFKTDSSKGLILWLPGGRGMIDSIGRNANYYTSMGYDLFVLNYRGFGKSEGEISSERQFNADLQSVYDSFKKEYGENHIVIFGYSLGTGPAAILAAANNPQMLIIKAPYYELKELVKKSIPLVPVSMLLKYEFKTFEALQKVKSQAIIIHGDEDTNINVEASQRLKKYLKKSDEFIILKGQAHNNFIKNPEYLSELNRVLNQQIK